MCVCFICKCLSSLSKVSSNASALFCLAVSLITIQARWYVSLNQLQFQHTTTTHTDRCVHVGIEIPSQSLLSWRNIEFLQPLLIGDEYNGKQTALLQTSSWTLRYVWVILQRFALRVEGHPMNPPLSCETLDWTGAQIPSEMQSDQFYCTMFEKSVWHFLAQARESFTGFTPAAPRQCVLRRSVASWLRPAFILPAFLMPRFCGAASAWIFLD